MLCCPMTTRRKGYPFEVQLSADHTSVVLANQIKSLDWRTRRAKQKGRMTAAELAEVRAKAIALIANM